MGRLCSLVLSDWKSGMDLVVWTGRWRLVSPAFQQIFDLTEKRGIDKYLYYSRTFVWSVLQIITVLLFFFFLQLKWSPSNWVLFHSRRNEPRCLLDHSASIREVAIDHSIALCTDLLLFCTEWKVVFWESRDVNSRKHTVQTPRSGNLLLYRDCFKIQTQTQTYIFWQDCRKSKVLVLGI